ncbi:LysR family substrate-binding domain-containing protein [Antribacter gilvus]|uniref:LysR family substrate-binding domain-containing protein n=1 Tax=Antribacter gilvus TaxID=2304675 RepID=UPI000F79F7AF|nr:LysR family substrate-binding domain-containing protein [Antribacter gilvus]
MQPSDAPVPDDAADASSSIAPQGDEPPRDTQPADEPTSDDAPDSAEPPAADDPRPRFRLAFVPGATPGKWVSVWRDRIPDVRLDLVGVEAADVPAALLDGRADAAIGRLPVDPDLYSAIPLYEEASVVCVSRDHMVAALEADEAVALDDIADETVWLPLDDVLFAGGPVPGVAPTSPDPAGPERPATTLEALAVVAANVGIAILPQSVARLHHRKDVVFRRLEGGPVAPVGLVWPKDRTTDLVEEMIGIVRGRTVNSSRGRGRVPDDAPAASPKGPAKGTGTKGTGTKVDAARGGRSGGAQGSRTGGRAGGTTGRGARPSSGEKGKKKGKGRK